MADYDERFAHLDVRFYNGTKLNRRKTEEARKVEKGAAAVYDDQEMIAITFPGMKDSFHAPAHSQCAQAQLGADEMGGGFITYAQKFHKHYEHWKEHGGDQLVAGTPIEEAKFCTPAQIESLKSMKVLSIEQLAGMNETQLLKIGPHGVALAEQAQEFVKKSTGNEKLLDEMQMLKAQIAELKGAKSEDADGQVTARAEPVADEFEVMDKVQLKEYIKARTKSPVLGNPSEDTLRKQARELVAMESA
tara:strand:- start:10194 stop:10934 length:741 start_codon:yes stop_codon:yes gene_type:complete